MEDRKWERYAALGGFVFVVLNVVGGFLPGSPPAIDDSPKQIAAYFKDHNGAIQAAGFMAGIGTIALLWWLGSLWRMMCRAENERPRLAVVAVVSAGAGGTLAAMSGAFTAQTAIYIDSVGEGAKGLFTLSMITISASGFFVVAFLSAVCALNWRAQMMPRWTSYVGWLAAAGFLVASGGYASGRNLFGVVGFISFLVWCVWILAVSTFMWRGASTESTAATS
jgi:hypothetical protein